MSEKFEGYYDEEGNFYEDNNEFQVDFNDTEEVLDDDKTKTLQDVLTPQEDDFIFPHAREKRVANFLVDHPLNTEEEIVDEFYYNCFDENMFLVGISSAYERMTKFDFLDRHPEETDDILERIEALETLGYQARPEWMPFRLISYAKRVRLSNLTENDFARMDADEKERLLFDMHAAQQYNNFDSPVWVTRQQSESINRYNIHGPMFSDRDWPEGSYMHELQMRKHFPPRRDNG